MTTTALLLLALLLAATPSAAFFLQPHAPRRRLKASISAAASDADGGPSLFVFGLGYVGGRLAQAVAAAQQGGWRVQGTSTKPTPPTPGGVTPFAFDPLAGRALDAEGLAALEGATHLLVSIPPLALSAKEETETEDAVLACYGETLQRRCPRLRWVGYLSSTSVYGDRGGGWVSEADAPQPVSKQGRARVRAEEGWRALVKGCNNRVQLDIFRLAGIYGPGRSALDTLRREVAAQQQAGGQGQWPLTFRVDAERPVSRVHVADIVRVLRCAMEHDHASGVSVYNVADDRPASRLEVFSYAAGLLGRSSSSSVVEVVAKEEEGDGKGGERAGAGRTRSNRQPESKRVDNRRVKEALLARCFPGEELLLYKDYEAGLTAIWEEEGMN